MSNVRVNILKAAEEIVSGHREQAYGTPEDNFATIAKLWGDYKGMEFTSQDVAMMMVLLKVARIASGTATIDSFIDIAGYAACGAEICANTERKFENE